MNFTRRKKNIKEILPGEPSVGKVQKAALILFFIFKRWIPSIGKTRPLRSFNSWQEVGGLLKTIDDCPSSCFGDAEREAIGCEIWFFNFVFSASRSANFLAHLSCLNKNYKHYRIVLHILDGLDYIQYKL